jgi:hypothetical protein
MHFKQSLLAMAAALCLSSSVHAAFFVSDDAPAVNAMHPEVARKDKRVYVPFTKGLLSSAARAHLDTTIDNFSNIETISITTYAPTRKALPAAQRRIAIIRSIMIRRGIPREQISVNAEVDPYIDPTDTDVQVVMRASTQRPNTEGMRAARLVGQPVSTHLSAPIVYSSPVVQAQPLQLAPQQTAISTPQQSQNTATLGFVKKIMAMASSKLITQESAVRLVNEYLANLPAPQENSTNTTGGTHGQAAMVVAGGPQIVPFGEVPRIWTLSANKSLRDNIREWAATAGYAELSWTASNLYQVTYSSKFTGTFLEVLNQVANNVPTVDFRVSRVQRTIQVVDAAQ